MLCPGYLRALPTLLLLWLASEEWVQVRDAEVAVLYENIRQNGMAKENQCFVRKTEVVDEQVSDFWMELGN
jgi:hypothetical protein